MQFDVSDNTTETNKLFFKSLGNEVKLIQINLILYNRSSSTIYPCLNPMSVELLIISV